MKTMSRTSNSSAAPTATHAALARVNRESPRATGELAPGAGTSLDDSSDGDEVGFVVMIATFSRGIGPGRTLDAVWDWLGS